MNDYRPYLSEFLGTFGIVFIGAGALLANSLVPTAAIGLIGISLASGLALMAMMYSLSSFSMVHFNPAITLAMAVHKRIHLIPAIGYVVAQLLGAVVAVGLLSAFIPQATASQLYGLPAAPGLLPSILLEAVLTFFLVGAYYGLVVNKRAPANMYGLAIGAVVTFGILAGGAYTGAAMNPARAFGPALVSGLWGPQAIYWAGPIIGALVASAVWEYLLAGQKHRK